MIKSIREYVDEKGDSPFAQWFEGLDAAVAAKVATSLYRMEQGNFSRVKGVGSGIFECKIDFGPGYRIYFGKDGEELVILLGGGSKKRQAVDIEAAMSCWKDYKRRKRTEQLQ
ncbi:MAG: type II toxin-antitoxin system RelE/ParE family toxin [Syntrophobacteraceae bacterium]